MVGQKGQMQHLRIGNDYIWRGFSNAFAPIAGGVTVIDRRRGSTGFQVCGQGFKSLQLILRQRF
jgi:hypothetical protein